MTDEKARIFVYKLTCDDGGAPCVENGLISLCICKPIIRKTAKEGDWIIGLGGKSVSELKNRLIYIMRVEGVVDGKNYYSPKGGYWNRSDCIYKWDGGKYQWKKDAKYHSPEHLKHDLGSLEKGYERARCLKGSCFAYFGGNEGNKNPGIEDIKDIYERVGQGYLVNHDSDTYKRLDNYIQSVFDRFGCGKLGEPTHSDKSKKCSEAEGGAVMQCDQSENSPNPCEN